MGGDRSHLESFIEATAPMRILLIQTGFLGDVVLSTPVPTNLAALYPGATIDVLTTPAAAPLMKYHPAVSQVVPYDKRGKQAGARGLFRLARDIRSRRYDMVFSLHKSWRTALLVALSRIPNRYGFREAHGRLVYSKTAPRSDLKHDVLRNLAILRNVGKEPSQLEQRMIVEPGSEASDAAERLSLPAQFVALVPGSVWATKRWSAERFAEVATKLVAIGHPVVFLGGPDDAVLADSLVQKVAGSVSLAGRISILETAAVIRKARGVITNDTALLHIASAAQRPTVAIFCATVPEFGFTPWMTEHEIVEVKELWCRPCGKHGGNTCPTGTLACQLGITSDSVVDALCRVWERAGVVSKQTTISQRDTTIGGTETDAI